MKQHPGSYITLDRRWEDGDRIEVTYPMRLAMERMPDNPRKGALLYGPVVLAGVLGTEGMQPPAPYSILFGTMITILTITISPKVCLVRCPGMTAIRNAC